MTLDKPTQISIVTSAFKGNVIIAIIYTLVSAVNFTQGSALLGVVLGAISLMSALEASKMWDLRKALKEPDSSTDTL